MIQPSELSQLHRDIMGGIYWCDYPTANLANTSAVERRQAIAQLLDAGLIERVGGSGGGWSLTDDGLDAWAVACQLHDESTLRSGVYQP